jgi:hypothetical protein
VAMICTSAIGTCQVTCVGNDQATDTSSYRRPRAADDCLQVHAEEEERQEAVRESTASINLFGEFGADVHREEHEDENDYNE